MSGSNKSEKQMRNTIIYLIGFAGTGKFTIAKEICESTEARLVDNHLINNPIFSLIRIDGTNPFPENVWKKTRAIRHIVLGALKNISPPDFSFVFTNELVEGSMDDVKLYNKITKLAAARGSVFVPVRLLIDESELCRRIAHENRNDRLKDTNAENARKKHQTLQVLNIQHANLLNLNVTELLPIQAAQSIISHAQKCGQSS